MIVIPIWNYDMNISLILAGITIILMALRLITLEKKVRFYLVELQDFQELLQMRNNRLEQHMAKLAHWTNEDLPEQLVRCLFEDQKITDIKDKLLIKDEEFYMSFKDPLIKMQDVFIQRINHFYQDFTLKTMQEVKEVLDAKLHK